MNEFLILLQAKLDMAKSQGNINGDISTLQGKLDKLKVEIEPDQKELDELSAKIDQLVNTPHKIKIEVETGNIDDALKNTAKVAGNAGKQAGQNFGNNFQKNVKANLNFLEDSIYKTIQSYKKNSKMRSANILDMFNLNREDIDDSVIKKVYELTKDFHKYENRIFKSDTNDDKSWDEIVKKSHELKDLLARYGKLRDTTGYQQSIDIADYFHGKKIYVGDVEDSLASTGYTLKELDNSFRDLGIRFTKFKKGAVDLDSVWEELIPKDYGLQTAITYGDQLGKIIKHLKLAQEGKFGEGTLVSLGKSGAEDFIVEYVKTLEDTLKMLSLYKSEHAELEKQIANDSNSSTETVVQNEEKKQQAYQNTEKARKKVDSIDPDESIIKSGKNVQKFDNSNDAARKAAQYFSDLLQTENAVVAVTERFGNLNGLTNFTVNIKRATGEVESLYYSLKPILDEKGNPTDKFYFGSSGGTINNAGAIKQIEAIERTFADYSNKLAGFKNQYSGILSGLTNPINEFEDKLSGLKNGTATINDVKNAFNELGVEAKNITQNLGRKLNPVDAAIQQISKGDQIIAGLKAEIKGLDSAPKEVNSALTDCANKLQTVRDIENREGRTANWSAAYNEWDQAVKQLTADIQVLKKEQSNSASSQEYKISDLKNQKTPYMSKTYGTVDKQMERIVRMLNNYKAELVEVTGVENDMDGTISKLVITCKDAEGAIKRFTMARATLVGDSGNKNNGLIQVGDVQILKTSLDAYRDQFDKLVESYQKVKDLETKQLSLDPVKNQNEIADISRQIDEARAAHEKLYTEVSSSQHFDSSAWDEEKAKIDANTESVRQNIQAKKDDSIENAVKRESSALDKLKSKWQEQGILVGEFADRVNEAENELKSVGDSTGLESVKAKIEGLKQAASSYTSEIKQTADAQKAMLRADTLSNTIVTWMKDNQAAAQAFEAELTNLLEMLKTVDKSADVSKIQAQFANIKSSAKANGLVKSGLASTMKDTVLQYLGLDSAIEVLQKITDVARDAVNAVIDVDTAMTELYKVTDESQTTYENFINNAGDAAKSLGRDMSSYIKQTSEWAKLGYSFTESQDLAKISSIYANVGDVDDSTAVSDMVTAMKSFNIEASDSVTIIDSLNKLGNEFAVSSAGLGDALARSASSMSSAGSDIHETLAMITGGSEITQNPAEFGNFLKVASMRIRGMKGELEDLGESVDDSVDSISKVQTQILNLTSGKVNIFDENGDFRNYYDIMKDISELYDSLSSTNKASLDEILFGKQRANQGAAFIKAFQSGQIQKALEASQNAMGSAQQEQERWMESIEAKMQVFQATWQDFSNSLIDSDLVKGIVDFGTSALDVLDGLIDRFGGLKTLLGGAGIATTLFGVFKNFGNSNEFAPYGCESIVA